MQVASAVNALNHHHNPVNAPIARWTFQLTGVIGLEP